MCRHFDPGVPRQCREDGAEEVREKERLNFCDWFVASEEAFDAQKKSEEDQAKVALDALFEGTADGGAEPDAHLDEAEKLVK